MLIGSGMAERYHKRFFDSVPMPEGVTFESKTEVMVGFNVAGPKSREILQTLTDTDLSNEAFPFMRSKQLQVAGIDVLALRVSFTGDLGWEMHTDEANQVELYEALLAAGKPHGMEPIGGRTLLSLRIEKGYGSWGREYSPEYWPQEVGLDRLIKLDKPEFLGREAYVAIKDEAPRWELISLEIEVENADASGGEPIFTTDGEPCGQVSSGAYGHSVGASLALGFIKAPYLDGRAEYDVMILGKPHRARLLSEPKFDPSGARLRA
jgi:dimethylglycine dehydrogenase